jgi:hypothetical protein
VKRGVDVQGQDLDRLARQFSTQEFLDLQVWHNLAWFGYGSLQRFPRLAELRAKNRGFTEEDKQEVLALQQTAIRQIVPMYTALQERGQIELTTTPFFSPDSSPRDRLGIHSPRQAGPAAARSIPCSGRCRRSGAAGNRLPYAHVRPCTGRALAL